MNDKIVDIKGMHCASCELLIEEEVTKIPGVRRCKVNYRKGRAEITHDGQIDSVLIKSAIEEAGYSIGKDEGHFFSRNPKDYLDLGLAAFALFAIFLLAQALGVFELGSRTGSNYNSLPVVFLIGLTAGISTCMAIVGGLVLGASARFAEKHPLATTLQKFKPHIFFNLGRIASYTILGGAIGYLGSFLQLSTSFLGLLTIAVGLVMLLLGVQLTEVVPGLNRFKIIMPKQISKLLGIQQKSTKEYSHTNSAFMGALTFFLPCGFTQAMQLYAISSGSPLIGALTMGTFAIGTAPGLLGLGGLTSVVKGAFARHFFRFAGIAVVLLAVFNISNGFNLTGFNLGFPQSFTSSTAANAQEKNPNAEIKDGVQIVKMAQTTDGYTPNKFTIQKGIPVKWIIDSQDSNNCASALVAPGIGVKKGLAQGENIITFTPEEIGTIRFSCIMGMYTGSFNVVEATYEPTPTTILPTDKISTILENKTLPTPTEVVQTPTPTLGKVNAQILKATFTIDNDIQPQQFRVKADEPARLEIDAIDDGAGCMGSVMIPGLTNSAQFFTKGETTVLSFTAKKGKYYLTCAMGVPRGEIIAE
ncbi:sulfite exporter TauE/SafE family protein [Patescibacteria group bacterium]|nr:sulfite exporter TauE/SafE family protein [Patescibacteria group bacterium]MBU4016608.1 sulfite exporter TauE/SafE family protein [Patescibacteria group bacterium]MBU4098369.1 sulfite exporter TauE/SafE family protein [Patescibacteria group bacterium]